MLILQDVDGGVSLDGVETQEGGPGRHPLALADQNLGDHATFPVAQGLAAGLDANLGGRRGGRADLRDGRPDQRPEHKDADHGAANQNGPPHALVQGLVGPRLSDVEARVHGADRAQDPLDGLEVELH
ncbi:MAG: hypothetical protein Q8M38_00825 [Phenylobacterium sp.]|nr:hypothetical protein [Phenylobacterium sp.]MDP1874863.1 hypothetical protein [Phenylobacterium sp.]MDP3298626.1 hypothetical protein [Phenylobacterium sp.]